MPIESIPADRPAAAPSALRTEPEQKPAAEQRVADAAAKRPAPVDQAQVSPQARQLAAAEEQQPADASQKQQRTDEKRQPERLQAQQQQGQVAAQKRFEVVA